MYEYYLTHSNRIKTYIINSKHVYVISQIITQNVKKKTVLSMIEHREQYYVVRTLSQWSYRLRDDSFYYHFYLHPRRHLFETIIYGSEIWQRVYSNLTLLSGKKSAFDLNGGHFIDETFFRWILFFYSCFWIFLLSIKCIWNQSNWMTLIISPSY